MHITGKKEGYPPAGKKHGYLMVTKYPQYMKPLQSGRNDQ